MKSSTVRLAQEREPEMTAHRSRLIASDHHPAMPGDVTARIERALAAEAVQRTTLSLSGPSRWPALLTGTIQELADEVGVTVVPRVLLNHVEVDPAQR
jgi:hypothetical protein